MTFRIAAYLAIFWLMQIVAQLFLKWGSVTESRWIWGFLLGNLFGASSVWFLMLAYKAMNPNIAMGLALGGGFLFCQLALVLVYKSKVTPMQWMGIAAIVVGMIIFSAGMQQGTKN